MSEIEQKDMQALVFKTMHFIAENLPPGEARASTLMSFLSSISLFIFSGYASSMEETIALMREYGKGVASLPYEEMMQTLLMWDRRN